ncbi:uncharacterized protein LOC119895920 [Micropterus salmoides]|uniref:uncharacterized protein LOC119895920 n=1 Tax=Micropterus salmoides TaxID=27706 RepID=UPI0018EC9CF0|nr:uncharacterized protein LOC119895920 [Micropterus salmoides]
MANNITHLNVSLDEAEEQMLQSQGFKKINVNLNKGAGGNVIYIWYKKLSNSAPITRVQVSFNDEMAVGLAESGYKKIPKDLNAGAKGNRLYLWYFRGNSKYDTPIVDIDITTDAAGEARKFCHGWERLVCDLNRNVGGSRIYGWVKRKTQTYICDVTATDCYTSDSDYFQEGYIRMDEDTNRGAGGAIVFIWYRQTTNPKTALTDLQISTNGTEYQELQQQNYTAVNVNLNEGTGGNKVYLWHTTEGDNNPIEGSTLLLNPAAVPLYEKAGATVVKRNINAGNKGSTVYLCVNNVKG